MYYRVIPILLSGSLIWPLGGKPHIEGHRIAVHHIAWWYSQGESAEALASEYYLTLAEIHAALAYCYDHKDEIDREIAREAAEHAARADADTSPLRLACGRPSLSGSSLRRMADPLRYFFDEHVRASLTEQLRADEIWYRAGIILHGRRRGT